MKPWQKLPIIGLSPMDGVSDAAFRFVADKIGHPDMLFTEFVPVEAIARRAVRALLAFAKHDTSTPTIAQIYGTDIEAYYKAALVVCELGFDGVDINMGCPDKSVSGRGAGAGLIQTPKLATDIIKKVKRATSDWSAGMTLEKADLHPNIIDWVKNNKKSTKRSVLPVSVKTRIGFDKVVTKDWTNNLLEAEPVAITLHGRTLKQMYSGSANWDEIAIAAQCSKGTKTLMLGNGDIKSMEDARKKIENYRLDGVLIGRATLGNPWFFQDKIPTSRERLEIALLHCKAFDDLTPDGHFPSLRKHLAWYCRGFDDAAKIRDRLMHVSNYKEALEILNPVLIELKV